MKDESPFEAVLRVMKSQFDIVPDNHQVMMIIDAVRETLPPRRETTIATLRTILRSLEPNDCLERWASSCAREIVLWLSKQGQVHKVAEAVDDERLWCLLEGSLTGMLLRVTSGKDLWGCEEGPDGLVDPKACRKCGCSEEQHRTGM